MAERGDCRSYLRARLSAAPLKPEQRKREEIEGARHLRARLSAAPLTRRRALGDAGDQKTSPRSFERGPVEALCPIRLPFFQRLNLRARLSAAPLKLLCDWMVFHGCCLSPRSFERGPVEARHQDNITGGPVVNLRARLSAAPLKQFFKTDGPWPYLKISALV